MILRYLTLILAFNTSVFSSELIGSYKHDTQSTVVKVNSDSSETKRSKRKMAYFLELNDDNTVRFARQKKGKISDYDQYQGAWTEHGGNVFYYMESFGEYRYVSLASAQLKKEGDTLTMKSIAGVPIVYTMSSEFNLVDSLEFPHAIDTKKVATMKVELAEIIDNIPDEKFEGRATEEEFKRDFHAAIKAEDISTLMKLTKPQPNERIADVRLHYYLKYVQEFKREGVYAIEDKKDVEKYISMFPSNFKANGHFSMRKKVGKSSGGTSWFYGIVDGKWALIGNPQRKK